MTSAASIFSITSATSSFCGQGFYGLRVHEAALEKGVKVTGATVHFVNEIPDGGEIIASGTDAEVREKARGKVFLLPEAAQLPAGSFVEKRLEGEEGTLLRVLAPTPVKEGRPAEPTVEDGYMALIKKI